MGGLYNNNNTNTNIWPRSIHLLLVVPKLILPYTARGLSDRPSFKKPLWDWKCISPFLLLLLSSSWFSYNQFPKPSGTLKSNQRFKCPTFFTRPCFKSFYASKDLRKSERASERQRYFKTVATSLALLVGRRKLEEEIIHWLWPTRRIKYERFYDVKNNWGNLMREGMWSTTASVNQLTSWVVGSNLTLQCTDNVRVIKTTDTCDND